MRQPSRARGRYAVRGLVPRRHLILGILDFRFWILDWELHEEKRERADVQRPNEEICVTGDSDGGEATAWPDNRGDWQAVAAMLHVCRGQLPCGVPGKAYRRRYRQTCNR